MQKRIVFKNMDRVTAMEDFANKKLEAIEKLLETEKTPISINLVIEGFKNHAHNKIELMVDTAEFHLVAHHIGPDIYKEIDIVMQKMLEEVRTVKDRLNKEKKKKDTYKSA